MLLKSDLDVLTHAPLTNWLGQTGNTKGGCITVPLTSCFTGLDQSAMQIKTRIVSCHTADAKPVKQEINCAMILPLLVFPCSNIW